ncbi:MAG: ATP synthase F1 subunit epsilon [Planctomycetota bacterium]
MRCVVVTPETTLRDAAADFVALTLFDGEIGIGPGHTPLIGRLGFGEMRIRQGTQTERYYVEGGFVEVADDVVNVLTPRAIPAAQLDEAVARAQLSVALEQPANTPELMAQRDTAVAQSRSQMRVARRAR